MKINSASLDSDQVESDDLKNDACDEKSGASDFKNGSSNVVKKDSSQDKKVEKDTDDKIEKELKRIKESENEDTKDVHKSEDVNSLNATKLHLANKIKHSEWEDYHDKLLRVLKKEVKQIMEEAVTKKCVHEESSSITSLCGAIDACLSHGLKRRALGLFKTNSTTALLQKTAKNCDSASKVYKIVTELERHLPKGSLSSDSLNKFRLSLSKQAVTPSSVNNVTNIGGSTNINGTLSAAFTTRYLWIRIALFEKSQENLSYLYNIVDHLVNNSSIYYEKEALVSDPALGKILVDLIVGPCTLDFSKMRNQDHIYTDPPADELVQRHNLISSSPSSSCTSSPLTKTSNNALRRAPLYLPYYKWFNFINSTGSSSGSNETNSSLTQSVDNHLDDLSSPVHTTLAQRLSLNSPFSPKEYVESLHQNCKSTLLYGKNNVFVQPNDNLEALPGYLSLHQSSNSLEIRWTPNQLIKGKKEHDQEDNSSYWEYALNIFVEDTVYLHCHHNEQGGVAVFIGHDGVQQPSIRFPKGTHLLAFLTCLEAGLLPKGQLDPPLGLQKGKGKVFPLVKRRTRSKSNKSKSDDKKIEVCEDKSEEITNDYVFRIIFNSLKPESISEEMFNPKSTQSNRSDNACFWKSKADFRQKLISTSSNSSTSSSKSLSEEFHSLSKSNTTSSSSLQTVCKTMKHQIISRAFYGWLAYCRHLKTVRTHLSGLVNSEMTNADDPKLSLGLTEEQWINLHDEEGRITDVNYLLKLVYFGYCEHALRAEVWPYLLGHNDYSSTKQQREQQDEEMRQNYELLMTEWLAVEAIVKIRDRENLTASLAKFNSEEHSQSNGAADRVDQLDDVFSEHKSPSKSKEAATFLIDKLLKDVIEEDENCDECKFDEEENDDLNNSNETRSSSAALKANNLKRQRNIYTQSSTNQSMTYANHNQILITDASVDLCRNTSPEKIAERAEQDSDSSKYLGRTNADSRNDGQLSADHSTCASACASPVSSNGGVYTNELLDIFSLNLTRIDKDVQRCDRNYSFFMNPKNLEKLRNIICTYVWKNLQNGYVQGMCDLVAPLLTILEDEMLTYSCFCELMKRMSTNFPHIGVAINDIDTMDIHFANMRSLIQILDPELFELMHSNGDYTHFYFCYRWFLLDFKREFNYEDVFKLWEIIWASKTVASPNMVLFIALALVEEYREIILGNTMDFTDIIKFFNEMAERHNVNNIVVNARKLVFTIQSLIS